MPTSSRYYNKPQRSKMTVFIIILLTAAISGVLTYLWQKSVSTTESVQLQTQLTDRQEKIDGLEKEIEALNAEIVSLKPDKKSESIITKSNNVLLAIKNKDMEKLSTYVHPDKGLIFTPYAYVDPKKDIVFTANSVKGLLQDNKKYSWGAYDGTGDPIELTFNDYYNKFIYDVDFTNAVIIGNNHRIGQGNSLNNIEQVFPSAVFIEYHFPGFEKQYEGMDWRSLRLVFEKKNDIWYLIAIIHDQWTI